MSQARLQSLIDSFRLTVSLRMERGRHNSSGAKQNGYLGSCQNALMKRLSRSVMNSRLNLSIPLLKRLISGSQGLYRQVQLDEHWASRCQLSVNDQGLVIKWGSRIVVPEDEELRSLLITEFHDSKYAGHFGMSRTRVAVGRMF
jgi:hypothetical protein